MPKFVEPLIATRIKNPLNVRNSYRWVNNGLCLDPGQEAIVPYEVYTACRPELRPQLENDVQSGRCVISYRVRGIKVENVQQISTGIQIKEKGKKPKPEKPQEVEPSTDVVKEAGKIKMPEEVTMNKAMGWDESKEGKKPPKEGVALAQAQNESRAPKKEKPAAEKKASAKPAPDKKKAASKKK